MAPESIHDLTAAYALDALDARERDEYEDHLAGCERCRGELGAFSQSATALAYGVESPQPPPALRTRIVDAARAERTNVVPLRSRRAFQTLAAATAVAAALAIGFGVWAASLHSRLQTRGTAAAEMQAALAVLADQQAQRYPLDGRGSIVVAPTGEAALVTRRLPAAPSGKTYEAWVIQDGKPEPAGLLRGGHDIDVLRLEKAVPNGAYVALTLEPAGGSAAPTGSVLVRGRA
jgi:anti-sigma-K factor RskA